ncbi:unnamed protein product [Urochloa humidicola]
MVRGKKTWTNAPEVQLHASSFWWLEVSRSVPFPLHGEKNLRLEALFSHPLAPSRPSPLLRPTLPAPLPSTAVTGLFLQLPAHLSPRRRCADMRVPEIASPLAAGRGREELLAAANRALLKAWG